MGRVTEIGVRASKVLSWNGSEVIVPNGILISKKVVNWTLANEQRRLEISVKTPFNVDPEEIIEILINVASQHTNTLEKPAPMALFNGYESHALDFTIYCWVSFKDSLSTKSEIAIGIFKALAAAGIEAPIPIQKISLDKSES
jgi:potassium efflux system protein